MRCVGGAQENSQVSYHPVRCFSEHSSGEDTSSLETHRRPGRMNEDSSEFPHEPHALSILPIRTPDRQGAYFS